MYLTKSKIISFINIHNIKKEINKLYKKVSKMLLFKINKKLDNF
jgi:hypothetical protein